MKKLVFKFYKLGREASLQQAIETYELRGDFDWDEILIDHPDENNRVAGYVYGTDGTVLWRVVGVLVDTKEIPVLMAENGVPKA